ncbi:MAG: asparaginase [Actinobacteria bacterium]|nr:asparaginase [Actinomycetota bacterium]
MALPEVAVLSLGGTISSTQTEGRSGVAPSLTGEALVEDVPEISEVAEVSADSFRQVPGSELVLEDLIELAAEFEGRIDTGAAGVVVTQGTDSIEETSFVLDLLVDRDAPVVVTGAMRNPTLPGAEGPANLLASVRVAISEAARGLGAVVVLNDEIHAARFVQKTHTSNPATFRSPLAGPIGYVFEDNARIVTRPVGRRHIDLPPETQDRPVALYTIGLGDDGRLLEFVRQSGYEGLVVEAFGVGHVHSVMTEPLGSLANEIPVVLASRTGSGEVHRKTYGFTGSESDLSERGLINAGMLDGPKARLFLSLLLRSGASREEISGAFGLPFGA